VTPPEVLLRFIEDPKSGKMRLVEQARVRITSQQHVDMCAAATVHHTPSNTNPPTCTTAPHTDTG